MTEDVGFYVELAREADGPLVELAIGNGRVAIPVAQATGRRVIGIDTSPAMLEQARVARRRGGRRPRPARGRHARPRARRAGGADLLPVPRAPAPARRGPTGAAPSSGSLPRSVPADGSRGTRSRSTTRSPRGSTDCTRTSRCRTRSGTRSATTGSTSRSTTAARARCGGRRGTNGSGSSTWQDSSWKPSTAASTGEPFGDESREYVFVARR